MLKIVITATALFLSTAVFATNSGVHYGAGGVSGGTPTGTNMAVNGNTNPPIELWTLGGIVAFQVPGDGSFHSNSVNITNLPTLKACQAAKAAIVGKAAEEGVHGFDYTACFKTWVK